jgi:hypothetical protein
VQDALAALPWVRTVEVEADTAHLTVEADRYDPDALLAALEDAGFGGRIL